MFTFLKEIRTVLSIYSMTEKCLKTDVLESVGVEMPVYRREGSAQGSYYATVFDYLNTSYSISADVSQEEFKKIIENILIKSE